MDPGADGATTIATRNDAVCAIAVATHFNNEDPGGLDVQAAARALPTYRELIRSSAPFGHSLPYLSTYFFCANVRKAAMSGV